MKKAFITGITGQNGVFLPKFLLDRDSFVGRSPLNEEVVKAIQMGTKGLDLLSIRKSGVTKDMCA
jgi:GDP-D-mannose dehydratase